MKGVMMPGVSAGSSQVGASDICTPQVSCPLGAPARAVGTAAPSAASARTLRRVKCMALPAGVKRPQHSASEPIFTSQVPHYRLRVFGTTLYNLGSTVTWRIQLQVQPLVRSAARLVADADHCG